MAIRSLSRIAAAEWGKHDIGVNVIIPSMLTDSADSFFEARPGIREKLADGIPLRRFGDVERDMGPVAVFLASSDSDFITAQARFTSTAVRSFVRDALAAMSRRYRRSADAPVLEPGGGQVR